MKNLIILCTPFMGQNLKSGRLYNNGAKFVRGMQSRQLHYPAFIMDENVPLLFYKRNLV